MRDWRTLSFPFIQTKPQRGKRAKQNKPSEPPSCISPNFGASVWGEHQDLSSLLPIRQLHVLHFGLGLEACPRDRSCLLLLLRGGLALLMHVVLSCFLLLFFSKLWLFLLGLLTSCRPGFHFLLHKTRECHLVTGWGLFAGNTQKRNELVREGEFFPQTVRDYRKVNASSSQALK